jgi:hypothetical protein
MDTPQPDWEQSRNIIRSPEVRDREHTLLSFALEEVQNKGRVWYCEKNVR